MSQLYPSQWLGVQALEAPSYIPYQTPNAFRAYDSPLEGLGNPGYPFGYPIEYPVALPVAQPLPIALPRPVIVPPRVIAAPVLVDRPFARGPYFDNYYNAPLYGGNYYGSPLSIYGRAERQAAPWQVENVIVGLGKESQAIAADEQEAEKTADLEEA